MENINVNDYVVCLHNEDSGFLSDSLGFRKGHIYKVSEVKGTWLRTKKDSNGQPNGWSLLHFKKVGPVLEYISKTYGKFNT